MTAGYWIAISVLVAIPSLFLLLLAWAVFRVAAHADSIAEQEFDRITRMKVEHIDGEIVVRPRRSEE